MKGRSRRDLPFTPRGTGRLCRLRCQACRINGVCAVHLWIPWPCAASKKPSGFGAPKASREPSPGLDLVSFAPLSLVWPRDPLKPLVDLRQGAS